MTSARRIEGLMAGAAAVLAVPADAAVSARNPAAIVRLLDANGYEAQIDRSASGDPMIRFKIDSKSVQVLFYGCTAGARCQSLQLTTGYDLPEGISYERANAWARENRWGKVHLDDALDPFVQYDIVTSPQAVSDANFLGILAAYRDTIERFANYIEY